MKHNQAMVNHSYGNICLLCSLLLFWFTDHTAAIFTPNTRAELAAKINACLEETPDGTCPTVAGTDTNGIIGEWDTSRGTSMNTLFKRATKFNADLSKWITSKVTSMDSMFHEAEMFDGCGNVAPCDNSLNNWDVSRVTNMDGMFRRAYAFNNDLSKWQVTKVTRMSRMFVVATAFNGDISTWVSRGSCVCVDKSSFFFLVLLQCDQVFLIFLSTTPLFTFLFCW